MFRTIWKWTKKAAPFLLVGLIVGALGYWREFRISQRVGRAEAQIGQLETDLNDAQRSIAQAESRVTIIESSASDTDKGLKDLGATVASLRLTSDTTSLGRRLDQDERTLGDVKVYVDAQRRFPPPSLLDIQNAIKSARSSLLETTSKPRSSAPGALQSGVTSPCSGFNADERLPRV